MKFYYSLLIVISLSTGNKIERNITNVDEKHLCYDMKNNIKEYPFPDFLLKKEHNEVSRKYKCRKIIYNYE